MDDSSDASLCPESMYNSELLFWVFEMDKLGASRLAVRLNAADNGRKYGRKRWSSPEILVLRSTVL